LGALSTKTAVCTALYADLVRLGDLISR
jgi:hypothetical protein